MADFKWYQDEVFTEVGRAKKKVLRKAGSIVSRDAKALCPVGEDVKSPKEGGAAWTGRVPGTLKKSIRYRVTRKGDKVQVIAGSRSSKALTAFYARFVEFGTRKMTARPFLIPAVHKNRQQIEGLFKDQMK
jgi:HK97 gp10 family phage protein